jgi:SAM-dependent methyltransferase
MNKTIYIDSTNLSTELCQLGSKYNTDKSPFSINASSGGNGDRKGYTAFYHMLFSNFKNKEINFLEIGIRHGASMQMWEEYFSSADLFGFEKDNGHIEKCKMLAKRTKIFKTDVSIADAPNVVNKHGVSVTPLENTLQEVNTVFDVIIDDSTHWPADQIHIVNTAKRYLKSGGILIVEDLERNYSEDMFNEVLGDDFVFSSMVICHHDNRLCPNDNDKIWYGIKK